ncbi:unnamed protein product [Clonostachys solani]|uniref:Uncharacterized protein n=1 Tax=Clonostachys solani TaxID=160281 RepID=A0A9P0EGQ4_9HYPO|nr:unnamed protein product [Clonostachys solani]
MSYVATPEEIAIFAEYSLKPNFSQEAILLDFTTTEEFIKSILPPKFSPAEKPTGHIYVGTMESRLCGEFDCAIVSIDVIFNGKKGIYMIEMLISDDFPVTWGREVWGETKKTAQVKMYRAGDYRYAYVERNGVRLIDIEGKFGDDLPPVKREGTSFEIKAYPSSTGKGVQWDPIVNELAIHEDFPRRSTGVGRVTIRGSRNNPLHTIPILSITDFEYSSGLVAYEVLKEHALGVGNAYLPYLIGRHYDDIRTFKVGNLWAKLQGKPQEEETFPVRIFDSPGFKALLNFDFNNHPRNTQLRNPDTSPNRLVRGNPFLKLLYHEVEGAGQGNMVAPNCIHVLPATGTSVLEVFFDILKCQLDLAHEIFCVEATIVLPASLTGALDHIAYFDGLGIGI